MGRLVPGLLLIFLFSTSSSCGFPRRALARALCSSSTRILVGAVSPHVVGVVCLPLPFAVHLLFVSCTTLHIKERTPLTTEAWRRRYRGNDDVSHN